MEESLVIPVAVTLVLVALFLGKRYRRPALPDLTRGWQRVPDLELTLDLDRGSLNGVAVGESFFSLRDLGPVESPRTSEWSGYAYPSLGLDIDLDERDRVETYTLYWGGSCADDDFFRGKCLHGGVDLGFSPETRIEEIRERFGEPYWNDAERVLEEGEEELDLEPTFYYVHGEIEWQISFMEDQLCELMVTSPPTLADPEMRQINGVDRPWPPPRS